MKRRLGRPPGTRKSFDDRVPKGRPSECWPWQGCVDSWEYGQFYDGRRVEQASRAAWRRANEQEIPIGMVVMHSCDNPRCVNPSHLSLGTQKDNVRDAVRKGRHSKMMRCAKGAVAVAVIVTAVYLEIATRSIGLLLAGR